MVFLISLPLIKVDVQTTVNGEIGSKTNRFEFRIPISGNIVKSSLAENLRIKKGDTLLQLNTSHIKYELTQLNTRLYELTQYLADLRYLDRHQTEIKPTKLTSPMYQAVFLNFQRGLEKLELERTTLHKSLVRQQKLYDQRVIAAIDYEESEANYKKAAAEVELFKSQNYNQWRKSLATCQDEVRALRLRKEELENQLPLHTLRSFAKGELLRVLPLTTGQHVQAGLKVAELTPTTELVATCWVPPESIGLLKSGMRCSVTVDAFDFNEWGTIEGIVNQISTDAYLLNNQPYFRVECELKQRSTSLAHSHFDKLKKGMTLRANFKITERTLWDLLSDKLADWIDPRKT